MEMEQGQATRLVQRMLKTARDNDLDMASMTDDGVTVTVTRNNGNRWQVTVSGSGALDDAAFGMPEKPKDPVYPAYYDAGRTLLNRLLEHGGGNVPLSVADGALAEAGWQLNVGRDAIYTKLALTNYSSSMKVELWYDTMKPDGLVRAVRALGYELEEGRIK